MAAVAKAPPLQVTYENEVKEFQKLQGGASSSSG